MLVSFGLNNALAVTYGLISIVNKSMHVSVIFCSSIVKTDTRVKNINSYISSSMPATAVLRVQLLLQHIYCDCVAVYWSGLQKNCDYLVAYCDCFTRDSDWF